MKYIGAAYILWLAIHIAFSKPSTENAEQSASFAFKAVQDYEAQLKKGINPVFKSADIGLSQKTDFWR